MFDSFYKYDVGAWLFAILTGTLCYIVIRIGERLLFLIRTRRRVRHLNVNCSIQRDQSNYPCKLWIDFRNWTNMTLLMKIEGYKLAKNIRPDPKATQASSPDLLEIKFIENAPQQNAQPTLNVDSIIRHGENKSVWVPLDPSHSDDELENALKIGKIGSIKAEILWFGDKPVFTRFRPKIKRG